MRRREERRGRAGRPLLSAGADLASPGLTVADPASSGLTTVGLASSGLSAVGLASSGLLGGGQPVAPGRPAARCRSL
jgi:hypothetical protein